MDVERIQKVNNLALDLMKQGLAQDREEAILKAEQIFKERDTEDYASIRQTMEKDQPEREEQESAQNNSLTRLSEDKIKEIMGKNTIFIIKKFKEFQEKLDSMKKEIEFLRNTSQRGQAVREIVTNEVRDVLPPVQGLKSDVAQEQKPVTKQEDHPRSGNYKEDDVSIEKFFYMGNK